MLTGRSAIGLMLIALLIGVAGCQDSTLYPGDTGVDQDDNQTIPLSDSYGVIWKLRSFEDLSTGSVTNVPNGDHYTLTFRTGELDGKADCNWYGGEFTTGTDNTISITNIYSTEIACLQGSLEERYLTELSAAAGYSVTSSTLRLYNADKTKLLRFAPEARPVELLQLERILLAGSIPYTLTNAIVEGDILTATVTYPGGCQEHDFSLFGPQTIPVTDPNNLTLYLMHVSNGDQCEALINETRQFDLTPLKKQWQEATGKVAGSIMLKIHDGHTGIAKEVEYTFGLILGSDDKTSGFVTPSWLIDSIGAILSRPFAAPAVTIWEYQYNGNVVYYRTNPCCNIPSDLYDQAGTLICNPDDGFSGSLNSGQCPDFFTSRSGGTLVWKDPR